MYQRETFDSLLKEYRAMEPDVLFFMHDKMWEGSQKELIEEIGEKSYVLRTYAMLKALLEKNVKAFRVKLRLIYFCGRYNTTFYDVVTEDPEMKDVFEDCVMLSYEKCQSIYTTPLYLRRCIKTVKNEYDNLIAEKNPNEVKAATKSEDEREYAERFIAENIVDLSKKVPSEEKKDMLRKLNYRDGIIENAEEHIHKDDDIMLELFDKYMQMSEEELLDLENELMGIDLSKHDEEDWESCSKRRADFAIRLGAIADACLSKNDDIPNSFLYFKRIGRVAAEFYEIEKLYPDCIERVLDSMQRAYKLYYSFSVTPDQYLWDMEICEKHLLKYRPDVILLPDGASRICAELLEAEKAEALASLGEFHKTESDIIDGYICTQCFGREQFAVYVVTGETDKRKVKAECDRLFDGESFVRSHEYRVQTNVTCADEIEPGSGLHYDNENNYISFVAGMKYRYYQREGTDD